MRIQGSNSGDNRSRQQLVRCDGDDAVARAYGASSVQFTSALLATRAFTCATSPPAEAASNCRFMVRRLYVAASQGRAQVTCSSESQGDADGAAAATRG